uniref:Uncharacterized protein n=1 Tax=Steinernema glaseri TaxID=37863 RepID=A0A1I7ZT47_9BILA
MLGFQNRHHPLSEAFQYHKWFRHSRTPTVIRTILCSVPPSTKLSLLAVLNRLFMKLRRFFVQFLHQQNSAC